MGCGSGSQDTSVTRPTRAPAAAAVVCVAQSSPDWSRSKAAKRPEAKSTAIRAWTAHGGGGNGTHGALAQHERTNWDVQNPGRSAVCLPRGTQRVLWEALPLCQP